ncbi:MAG: acyltransferase [Planctomycetota bacterium]
MDSSSRPDRSRVTVAGRVKAFLEPAGKWLFLGIADDQAEPAKDSQAHKPAGRHARIHELDALRALAAISLMLFHLTHVYSVKFGYSMPLGFVWPYGAYGTEMFFILSGFVNAMSLLRRRQPKDFILARVIRIVPLFLIIVLINMIVVALPPHASSSVDGISTGQWIANLTLAPRLLGYECVDPVMWTLQVEMMFYGLLVTLYVSGLLRRPLFAWGSLLVFSFVVCRWQDGMHTTLSSMPEMASVTFVRRLMLLDFVPLFAIGFLTYMIKIRSGRVWHNLIGIASAVAVFHCIDHGKHNPLATLLLIGLVTMAAYGKIPMLRLRPLLYISTISYALYLVHNNLGCAVIHQLDHGWGVPPAAAFAVTIALSIAVAGVVTYWVEAPLTQHLRKRFLQKPGSTAANADARNAIDASPGTS